MDFGADSELYYSHSADVKKKKKNVKKIAKPRVLVKLYELNTEDCVTNLVTYTTAKVNSEYLLWFLKKRSHRQ